MEHVDDGTILQSKEASTDPFAPRSAGKEVPTLAVQS
jgi:hypothetical protein